MIDIYELTKKTSGISLLYVEDNDMVREDTKTILDMFFTNIDIATDGAEGLEYCQKNSYDLLITDIRMPIMDGISMIKKIREFDQNIYIIIISAYDEEYKGDSIKFLNIDSYITKPFLVDNLIDTLDKISSDLK
jgi:YesN/AraC family two-component response regulator